MCDVSTICGPICGSASSKRGKTSNFPKPIKPQLSFSYIWSLVSQPKITIMTSYDIQVVQSSKDLLVLSINSKEFKYTVEGTVTYNNIEVTTNTQLECYRQMGTDFFTIN